MKNQIRSPLQALTGIRFLAALIVVGFHFATPTSAILKTATSHGFIGVTLFFILSGFILAYTYSAAPGEMKGSARSFWVARFARTFPMYLVGFVLMTPVILAQSPITEAFRAGLASLTLTQAWLPFSMRLWNPPGWSLSAEAFFYTLFPLLVLPVSRLSRRRLLMFVGFCWPTSLAAALVYFFTGDFDRDFWIFNPLVRLPEFLMGIGVGVLWTHHRSVSFVLPKYTVEAALLVFIVALCAPLPMAYYTNGAFAPLLAIIIVGLAENRGPAARLFGSPFLVALGASSYSLYILHWPLWYLGAFLVKHLIPNISANCAFWVLVTAVLIPASYVCHRFVEEPMSKYLRKRFSAPRPLILAQQVHSARAAIYAIWRVVRRQFNSHVWYYTEASESRICKVCGRTERYDYASSSAGSVWIEESAGNQAKHN